MQTICNKTSNIIDLAELRRQRAPAQHDSLARRTREGSWSSGRMPRFDPVVLISTPEERRRARRERHAWCLDICASLAVILMTAAFALRILI